jgi:hypothetical protein
MAWKGMERAWKGGGEREKVREEGKRRRRRRRRKKKGEMNRSEFNGMRCMEVSQRWKKKKKNKKKKEKEFERVQELRRSRDKKKQTITTTTTGNTHTSVQKPTFGTTVRTEEVCIVEELKLHQRWNLQYGTGAHRLHHRLHFGAGLHFLVCFQLLHDGVLDHTGPLLTLLRICSMQLKALLRWDNQEHTLLCGVRFHRA